MKTRTVTTKADVTLDAGTETDTPLYTAGLATMGISACAVGLWVAANLIGGIIASGGPLALVANWFRAVFGS